MGRSRIDSKASVVEVPIDQDDVIEKSFMKSFGELISQTFHLQYGFADTPTTHLLVKRSDLDPEKIRRSASQSVTTANIFDDILVTGRSASVEDDEYYRENSTETIWLSSSSENGDSGDSDDQDVELDGQLTRTKLPRPGQLIRGENDLPYH